MIYLASASPRRQVLLRQLGVAFEVIAAAIDERAHAGEAPAALVARLAREKALAGARLVRERGLAPRPVLGADTEVVLDGEVLGKPKDAPHARAMLARLAGRTHAVLTAVCVRRDGIERAAVSESRVTFGALDDKTIAEYAASGEPLDKSGAYAIQGRAAAFIARLEGSYSGVMGLPLYEVSALLKGIGEAT